MFIASVLAFCAGIYLQAVHPFSLGPLLLSVTLSAGAVVIFYHGPRKAHSLVVPLMLICSLFSGATRLAFVNTGNEPSVEDQGNTIYEGLVVEGSSHVKVLSLVRPAELKGMRVVFVSDGRHRDRTNGPALR